MSLLVSLPATGFSVGLLLKLANKMLMKIACIPWQAQVKLGCNNETKILCWGWMGWVLGQLDWVLRPLGWVLGPLGCVLGSPGWVLG